MSLPYSGASLMSNYVVFVLLILYSADSNDGTIFTPTNLNSTADMDNFLLDNWNRLDNKSLSVINGFFPVSDQFPSHGQDFFNAATAYGEMRYSCFGILASRHASRVNKPKTSWLYR